MSTRADFAISTLQNWRKNGVLGYSNSFSWYVSNRDAFEFDILESVDIADGNFKRGHRGDYSRKTREICCMGSRIYYAFESLSPFDDTPIHQIYLKDQLKPWIKDVPKYKKYLKLIFEQRLIPEIQRIIASYIGINHDRNIRFTR